MIRILLIALIAAFCLSALIAVYVVLFSEFDETESRLLGTTIGLGFYALVGLSASLWLEKRKFIILSWAGILLSIAAFIFFILLIWVFDSDVDEWIIKVYGTLTVLAIGAAYWSLVLLMRGRDRLADYLIYAVMVLVAVVTAMLIILLLQEFEVDEVWLRILGAISILTALTTIVAPIVIAIQAGRKREHPVT